MNLAMLMNPDMGAMPDDQFQKLQRSMALYGLGSVFQGKDAGNTLSSLMALNMGRHNRQTEAEKKRQQQQERQRILGSILGGGQGGGARRQPPGPVQRMGLDMGRNGPMPRNTTPAPSVPGMPPGRLSMGQPDMSGYQDAIASIESAGSGDYQAIGPAHPKLGRPLGRYQVMEANLPQWSREALGREVTAEEYLQNPEIQDAIFNRKFGSYVEQYGPEGAAQAWFGGPGNVGNLSTRDSLGTSTGQYTSRFNQALQGGRVRTAQAGPITREQVVMALNSDALSSEEKRFLVEEYRGQNNGGMTGKERYMNVDGVLYDVTGDAPVAVTDRQPNDSAAQEKVARIQRAYGVDERTAVGIADGVLRVSRDPYTDRIQVTNLATNEVWEPSRSQQGGIQQGGGQPPAEPAQQPGAQPQGGDLSFGDAYSDAENSFGLTGMFRSGVNAASDFVTGNEVFPETAQTQQDFAVLREDLTQDIQSAYGQRVPSWALQAIRDLTPRAGSFEGQGAAQNKLRSLGRRFEQELSAMESKLNGPGAQLLSPQERNELQSQVGGLRRAMGKIQNALQGFQGEGVEIRPEVADRLKAYE